MLEVVVEVDGRPLSPVGLRRRRVRHPDRLDGVQLQRRRPDRLARRRGAADGADQRARAVRPADGGRADVGARRRGAGPHRRRRACCGATAGAPSTCRRAPGSRCAAAPARCGWRGCTRRRSPTGWSRSSTCPVDGWRGAAERRRTPATAATPMLEELRITLARRDRRVGARARPGLHRDHRRDRRRQDHGGHRARPAARRPRRHRRGAHRRQAGPRRGPRRRCRRAGRRSPRRSTTLGGEVEDGRLVLARQLSAEGRSRAFVGGASVPVSALAALADPLVAVHGQSDQHRLLQAGRAARRARPVRRRPRSPPLRAGSPSRYAALRADRARAGRGRRLRAGAGPGGRPAAVRPRRGRGGRPASRARTPRWRPRRPGWASPTRCAPPPSRPARRCRPTRAARRPGRRRPRPGTLLDGGPRARRRGRPRWPTGWPRSATCSPTWPPTSRRTPPAWRPTRPGWPRVSERRAALTALTRKYGETIDEVLAWAEHGGRRGCSTSTTPTSGSTELHGPARPAPQRARRTLAARAVRGAHRGRGPAGGAVVTAELDLAGDAARRVTRRGHPERGADDRRRRAAAAGRRTAGCVHRHRRRRRRAPARRQPRRRAAAARQGRLRRRAVPGDAGARGGAGRRPTRCRRSSSTRSTPGSGGKAAVEVGRRLAAAGPRTRRSWSSPTCRRWRRSPTGTSWCKSSDGTVTTSGSDRPRRRGPGARAVPDAGRARGLRHRARAHAEELLDGRPRPD